MLSVFQPPQHLSQYVSCFWFGSFLNNESSSFTHLAHATTMPQIIFHLDGIFTDVTSSQQVFNAGVYGHSATYKSFTTSCSTPAIFGIQLYPSALQSLFDVPATDFRDQAIDLYTLLGHEAQELLERIFLSKDHAEILNISQSFISDRIRYLSDGSELRLQRLAQLIHSTNGKLTMREMADVSCLSERQLQRRFRELTGLTPKSYARIVRFESLIETFNQPGNNLTELADTLGYYDLSHCNHDFRNFTGLSPTEYLQHYGYQYS